VTVVRGKMGGDVTDGVTPRRSGDDGVAVGRSPAGALAGVTAGRPGHAPAGSSSPPPGRPTAISCSGAKVAAGGAPLGAVTAGVAVGRADTRGVGVATIGVSGVGPAATAGG
jgi:hypothetical protein